MQARKYSFIEAVVSTIVGFVITLLAQLILFPIYDIKLSTQDNLTLVAIMTVISVFRGYLIRRLFNYMHTKGLL